MNQISKHTLIFVPALLLSASLSRVVTAQSATQKMPSALSFDVTTRVEATGTNSLPAQTVRASVLLLGQRARIETQSSGTRAVVLFTPPFVYRLLPESKAGVKWKLKQVRGGDFGGFNPQQLLRDPSKIRGMLLQNGAKKTSSTVLNGAPVDIYEVTRSGQRFSQAKAWLRHADNLPVRLEASGSGLKVTASWSRYARPKNTSVAQFMPPKGFAIRESKNPPMLSIL